MTKVLLKCTNGHDWITRTDRVIYNGAICRKCSYKEISEKRIVDKETRIRQINIACDNRNLKLIEFVDDWKGGRTKIKVGCCNNHEWVVEVSNFINNNTGCMKCVAKERGNKLSTSCEIRLHQINSFCKDNNYTFGGFVGEWKGVRTKLRLKCMNNHEWTTTIDSAINYGRRCKKCTDVETGMKLRTPIEHKIQQINEICNVENITFFGFVDEDSFTSKSRIRLRCNCGHAYTPTFNMFVNSGRRCRKCSKRGYNTSKHGTLYIQKLISHRESVGIKFGITNLTTKQRMQKQSTKSKFDHEIFYELTLQDGQKILELENKIKEAMKGKTSYISKEDMPDGYTETVAPSELSTIMYIVKSFEKELTA